jgi:hypothetical protein
MDVSRTTILVAQIADSGVCCPTQVVLITFLLVSVRLGVLVLLSDAGFLLPLRDGQLPVRNLLQLNLW